MDKMDTQEKAFEFASESSKLLITLATGVIAILIAFLDKNTFLKPENLFDKILIISTWFILLGSAIVGIWTQLALTNVLEPKKKGEDYNPTIQDPKIKAPFRIQMVLFSLGIITTVFYGIVSLIF